MTSKEYLKSIRSLDLQIQNKQLEIKEIRNKMKGLSAITYEPKIGSSSNANTQAPQEKYYHLLEKYEEELTEDIDKLVKLKQDIMNIIDQIPDSNCVDILYKRYFQYMKWEEIAFKMNFSYKQVHRIHGKALKMVEEILKEK